MTNQQPVPETRVGVALGGGGARCFAHIGVLKAFDECGVQPVAFAGCSSGAVVGALYAAGHSPDHIYELFHEANFLSFLDVDFDGGSGLIGHETIADFLAQHLPETFGELDLPLVVAAVDIQTGDLVTMSEGPLLPAVCASNAFPGIFDPVLHDGRYLVDGGVLNLVPVDLVRSLTDEPVIAVDVSLPITRKLPLGEKSHGDTLWGRATATFKPKNLTLPFDLINKSYTITQVRLTQLTYDLYPPDLIIKPALKDDCMPHSFGRLEEAMSCGYEKAREVLADQRSALSVRTEQNNAPKET
ncbi:patatin-like phospholipase family protein [soil metagenome]